MDPERSLSTAAMIGAVAECEAAMVGAVAERDTAMLRAVQDERVAFLQALAGREAETSAWRDAFAADRAALESEIGAMEATVWRQESRVLLDVGGALFRTSRTTLTAVLGSMLEATFSGQCAIAAGEDEQAFIDRDGEHFGFVLSFMCDCGSGAASTAIRALPDTQLHVVRGELDYYGLIGAVFPDRFSLERASFVTGPLMDIGRA